MDYHYTKICLFKYAENFTAKTGKFSEKNSDIFHFSAQNIDCNEYPQFMCLSRSKKNNVYPCKPQFYYINVRFKGSKLCWYVFVILNPLCILENPVPFKPVLGWGGGGGGGGGDGKRIQMLSHEASQIKRTFSFDPVSYLFPRAIKLYIFYLSGPVWTCTVCTWQKAGSFVAGSVMLMVGVNMLTQFT